MTKFLQDVLGVYELLRESIDDIEEICTLANLRKIDEDTCYKKLYEIVDRIDHNMWGYVK